MACKCACMHMDDGRYYLVGCLCGGGSCGLCVGGSRGVGSR